MLGNTSTGACFSLDRRYRYLLWRIWDPGRGVCNFLMLNPSTADETTNDPTITRCEQRARRWGYGGLVVTNLFALGATDPAALRRAADPVGPENDEAIAAAALGATIVIGGWGALGIYRGRSAAVRALLASLGVALHALAWTKGGEPAHPLYLSYGCALSRMKSAAPFRRGSPERPGRAHRSGGSRGRRSGM
ncbi:MAG: DUF1643 domain-containing protein [Isosphaeraceae bacterium]|nr:DUF1643 domain-containing protein [Isosphaeraceae bacterium]